MDNVNFITLKQSYLQQFILLSPIYIFLWQVYFTFNYHIQTRGQIYLSLMKFNKQNKTQQYVYFIKINLQQTYRSKLTNHNLKDQFIFSKRNLKDIL